MTKICKECQFEKGHSPTCSKYEPVSLDKFMEDKECGYTIIARENKTCGEDYPCKKHGKWKDDKMEKEFLEYAPEYGKWKIDRRVALKFIKEKLREQESLYKDMIEINKTLQVALREQREEILRELGDEMALHPMMGEMQTYTAIGYNECLKQIKDKLKDK